MTTNDPDTNLATIRRAAARLTVRAPVARLGPGDQKTPWDAWLAAAQARVRTAEKLHDWWICAASNMEGESGTMFDYFDNLSGVFHNELSALAADAQADIERIGGE